MNIQQLTDLTTQVRRDILRMVHKVNSGHPGRFFGLRRISRLPLQRSNGHKTSFYNGWQRRGFIFPL